MVLSAYIFLAAAAVAPRPSDEVGLTQRYALFIGSNTGSAVEPLLRYAESDARNLAMLFTEAGDIPESNVVVLREPTADALREQFSYFRERIADERAHGNNALFFVYYSGHADALAMHLGGTLLPWNEFLHLTHQTMATTKLVVVDACRSGELTRVKGAHRAAPFLLPNHNDAPPQGLAILSSSTADESSQESDTLRGSLFTHHLIEALRGAADRNADGRVTLTEAFQYASDSTAFTSARTEEGLQHATYLYHLQGRADLTLTRPVNRDSMAFLNLPGVGEYRFNANDSAGALALDAVVPAGGRSVTLAAGRYFVQARTAAALRQGYVTVLAAHTATLDLASLPKVDLAMLALKGGAVATQAEDAHSERDLYALNIGGGVGAPLMNGFSSPWMATLLGQRRFDTFLVDLQLQGGQSIAHNNALTSTLTDASSALGIRGYWLLDQWMLSLGTRAGVVWIDQTYNGTNAPGSRWHLSPQLQAIARIDFNITSRFSVGLEGGARVLLLTRTVTTTGNDSTWIQVNPFGTLNVGWHW